MKITYPECQIEISAEEAITLIDHANLIDAGTQLVQEIEKIKVELPPINPEILRKGFGDEEPDPEPDPEPKPKQKSTRLKKPKKKMKLADIPFRMGRDGQTPEKKPTPKKDSGKKKKVDVRLDNGDWFTFDSVSAAADSSGGSSNGLSTALKNGAKFHGHEVRWSNPELDACLAEIEKSDKTPYQPSQRP